MRWKRREPAERGPWLEQRGVSFYAVLVECVRVDGKPKQRFIAHIGVFNDVAKVSYKDSRVEFWRHVERRLTLLGLEGETRAKIERQLAEKVGRPSDDEVRQAKEADEAYFKQMMEWHRRRSA